MVHLFLTLLLQQFILLAVLLRYKLKEAIIKFFKFLKFFSCLVLFLMHDPLLGASSKEAAPDSQQSTAQVADNSNQSKISLWNIFKKIPATGKETISSSFTEDTLPGWGLVLGSSLLLYGFDEPIYSGVQDLGRSVGVTGDNEYKVILRMGDMKILQLPKNKSAFFYYLGDGWMHAGFAAGMMVYGQTKSNNRAYNTGVMIIHGMMLTAIFDQILKRSFGRESPYVKTQDRGAWHPFVSFKKYQKNTPSYDAMPSGHIMTATLTFTVLSEQYAEYRRPIFYTELAYLTILGLQMVNIGVHWASDYPLGIAMGYMIGKAAVKMNQNDAELSNSSSAKTTMDDQKMHWQFLPLAYNDNYSLNLMASF